jgi:hypothetical protein
MWKLKRVGNSILQQYVEEMLPQLRNHLVCGRKIKRKHICLDSSQLSVLIPNYGTQDEDLSILKALLVYEPKELSVLCDKLMQKLIRNKYKEADLSIVMRLKLKRKVNLSLAERKLVNRYAVLDTLRLLFDYDGQISGNKRRSYWLTLVKDTDVCTYCNRQYTFTVTKVINGKKDDYIARPELDHWFSKEMYPIMSLSFYNLIPSCHSCNSSAKGKILFNLKDYIHPYLQVDDNPNITFVPTMGAYGYGVDIVRDINSREDNTIKAFNLQEVYNFHGTLEVKDLIEFNSAYNNSYLSLLFQEILSNQFGVYTKADVYRMLFGVELEPKDFGNRPLSKLKYDILKYLKVI